MTAAQQPCPTCGLTGGFHDNPDIDWNNNPSTTAIAEWEASPHKNARDRIPTHLTRPSHKEQRRQNDRLRWDQMERKEVRFRDDQVDALGQLTRSLSKQARTARSGDADPERITGNTLIRVAVDLLLSRAEQLGGATESELRSSIGLPDRVVSTSVAQ